MCPSPPALLRRATVYYHMDKFQMAAEDLRVVLKEEPHNPAATVGQFPFTCKCLIVHNKYNTHTHKFFCFRNV